MEEKVYFNNEEGMKLCGALTRPSENSRKCIVLCHGITVDKDEDGIFTNLASDLANVGFNVFRFDFRGHGESEGNSVDMTIKGEKRDLEAAIKLLEEKGFEEFGLLGASFGGGAVSLYLGENPEKAKALCLWNARIDSSTRTDDSNEWVSENWGKAALERIEKQGYTEIGSRKFRVGKALFDEFKSVKPWAELGSLDIPILFVHGDKDSIVPYEDSVKYSKLFSAEFVTIEGADHGFHDTREEAQQANKATVDFFLRNM